MARPADTFPFSAIVGQETLKLALVLNAVDPRVGGVLIRGEKGTAKSTAVRALLHVLPEISVIEGCRYRCDPADPGSWCDECRERRESGPLPKAKDGSRLIELPVSATEDRLVGTMDFEAALKRGERAFHPGLLADANRAILYVDEINLLDDHLVDTLLDAAAMGVNTVEREGVSFAHPARFILVGTMNPEEGEIRPQLLDRFGLCVDVAAVREPESRVEIVRRRRRFEADAGSFAREWVDAEDDTRTRIAHARLRIPNVCIADEVLYAIADLSVRAGVDGHRADSVMARAACALAALDGRTEATLADVERIAELALIHRVRRRPFDEVASDASAMRQSLLDALAGPSRASATSETEVHAPSPGEGQVSIFDGLGTASSAGGQVEHLGVALETPLDRTRRKIAGKRQATVADDSRGRYARSERATSASAPSDVALDATIRAAAVHQGEREIPAGMAVAVGRDDIHKKVRTRKVGASIVFCVDASGSMGASKRIDAAKAAVLELLVDAYQRRDRVSVVAFRGERAEIVLAPTASVELANLKLKSLPTGGATPLAAGLMKALELIDSERRRQPDLVPWLVLLTDGRANVGLDGGIGSDDAKTVAARVRASAVHVVVIDTAGGVASPAAREIARESGGEYVRLDALGGHDVARVVRERL